MKRCAEQVGSTRSRLRLSDEISDSVKSRQLSSAILRLSSLSDKGVIAADADADNELTVLDAAIIQRFIRGLERKLGL